MLNVGVVGYGYWGPNLARCLSETEDCRLVAIADQSPAALERAARRFPGALLVRNWSELVRDRTIDAVAIATPVWSHFEIAEAALFAGKHVLVEKPITSTREQAERLIDLAEAKRKVVLVDHTFCYTPAVKMLCDLIRTGTLGDLYYYVSQRMNLGLFQSDVDVIWDLAVHDIAILDYCLKIQPVAVSASGACHISGKPANIAHVTLFYEDGLIGDLNVNWLSPVKIRQSILSGNRRMVVYDDLESNEKIKIYDSGVSPEIGDPESRRLMLISYRIGDMTAPRLATTEALLVETRHFTDCILNGTKPITSGLTGLRVLEVLEAATRSMEQRGAPVELRHLQAVG
jgi:predicted dehydrogenase